MWEQLMSLLGNKGFQTLGNIGVNMFDAINSKNALDIQKKTADQGFKYNEYLIDKEKKYDENITSIDF